MSARSASGLEACLTMPACPVAQAAAGLGAAFAATLACFRGQITKVGSGFTGSETEAQLRDEVQQLQAQLEKVTRENSRGTAPEAPTTRCPLGFGETTSTGLKCPLGFGWGLGSRGVPGDCDHGRGGSVSAGDNIVVGTICETQDGTNTSSLPSIAEVEPEAAAVEDKLNGAGKTPRPVSEPPSQLSAEAASKQPPWDEPCDADGDDTNADTPPNCEAEKADDEPADVTTHYCELDSVQRDNADNAPSPTAVRHSTPRRGSNSGCPSISDISSTTPTATFASSADTARPTPVIDATEQATGGSVWRLVKRDRGSAPHSSARDGHNSRSALRGKASPSPPVSPPTVSRSMRLKGATADQESNGMCPLHDTRSTKEGLAQQGNGIRAEDPSFISLGQRLSTREVVVHSRAVTTGQSAGAAENGGRARKTLLLTGATQPSLTDTRDMTAC